MSLPVELERPVRATARRVRVQRALDGAATLGIAGLALAALALALVKARALSPPSASLFWVAALATPALGFVIGLARPVARSLPAKLLDRAHALDDRVTNALSFTGLRDRTPFMDAAIEDARAHAGRLSPKLALTLRAPRELVIVLGLGGGLLTLSALQVPLPPRPQAIVEQIDAVRLHDDDLEAYRSELEDILDDPESADDVQAAAREFNQIIEDIADERIDRAETLRRIAELERELQDALPADAELLRDALRELGEDLSRSEVAEELARALEDADAERAASETRRIAERLRRGEVDRGQLDALRRALREAADNAPEDRSEELERREEEQRRLLRRQRDGTASPQERRLLRRRQQELERLRRENREAMERREELQRLRREMQRAAEQLDREARDRSGASESLDRGAEDLDRMARQQMSQEQMQQLRRQLQELRELIRRQRSRGGGAQQRQSQGQGQGQSRMDRFVLRANGEGARLRIQDGQPGHGQPGQGANGQGQGANGQGQGQEQNGRSGERTLTLGGEGEQNAVLEIPGMGEGSGGQSPSAPGAEGLGAGTEHDPTMLDDPTRHGGTRQTVRVDGEQNDGPSRSEVILGSAQRGFANRPYRDVYTDYSDHAEEVLERDRVPPGHRFHVRRYFQLIRPREGD